MESKGKTVLTRLSLMELEEFVLSLGEKKFKAKQLHSWLYTKFASDFDAMSDLSKDFKQKLKDIAQITEGKIVERQISADGTIKYLVEYEDDEKVESVLMRFDNRANLTACISSQVGCALGCKFCATGQRGFVRNLTYSEIISQILLIHQDTGLKITNIVFMGQGEPLLNFENVYRALEVLNKSLVIGIRRITLSTCGIVPQIYELSKRELVPTLAISLHAASSAVREKIMPVEKKYSLPKLMEALKHHTKATGDRITIEYLLLDNVNDSLEDAKLLVELLKPLDCIVNLIIYNSVENSGFKRPCKQKVNYFKYIVENSGPKVTVRLERGADIQAACGQLSGASRS